MVGSKGSLANGVVPIQVERGIDNSNGPRSVMLPIAAFAVVAVFATAGIDASSHISTLVACGRMKIGQLKRFESFRRWVFSPG